MDKQRKGHFSTAGSVVSKCVVLLNWAGWAGDLRLKDVVVSFISRVAFGLFILTM